VAPAHPFRVRSPDEAAAGAQEPFDLVLGGSAFGGGGHPTTVSCLETLASLAPLDGLEVLDLGSGSGILALAALRLGARRATCVDVNPEAVASARRNGQANGLDARLDHRLGGAGSVAGASFDLLVANVGGELLLDLAGQLVPLVRPGGRLLLSGLLAGWGDELALAYQRLGCAVLARRAPEGFCTILLQRAGPAA
jgi:ribosomal protein L11 methyltransferase